MLRLWTLLALVSLTLISVPPAQSQELSCLIAVSYRNLSGSDYSFLDELEQRAIEYMNQRQWTEDRFEDEERINCSMRIEFTEAITLSQFRASLVVSSSRPIYGSAQRTQVLTLSDADWQFEYSQGTPLIFQPDKYDPITSVLNYYAYILLGFDYDTFDELGGQPHFEKARRIAEIAQNVGAIGWNSLGGDQSRGELISNIMDPRFAVLRTAYFDYHYSSLDNFIENTADSRRMMLSIVEDLAALREDVTRAYYLDQFYSAKYKEIVSVFRGSQEASQAFDALSKADPAHLSDYSSMLN